jgi:thiol:disulfide interchange protein DsbD
VLAQAQASLPKPASWPVVFSGDQDTLSLLLESPHFATAGIAEATFFPLEYGIIDHAAPQQVEITPQGLRLRLRRGTLNATNLTRIDGVLVLQEKGDSAMPASAFTVSAVPARAS